MLGGYAGSDGDGGCRGGIDGHGRDGGGREGGTNGGSGTDGGSGGSIGGGNSHKGSATFEYPANRKLRPVPAPPDNEYCTSKDDTPSKVNITERERCKSVSERGFVGLSLPVPTVLEQ